jgi:hypothetical protein
MGTGRGNHWFLWSVGLGVTLVGVGCDPAGRLENQEYRHYLDRYERWAHTEVVKAFNHLDSKRDQFACQQELDTAHRARWREKVGAAKLDQTPGGVVLGKCLDAFHTASGMPAGKLQRSVVSLWANHNFLPSVDEQLSQRTARDQQALGQASCGGDGCDLLTVVGDLAVPRLGQKAPVAWGDGRDACSRVSHGGLSPWRLPTRGELVAMKESDKLASDVERATYWSSSRQLADDGRIQAWVLRFDVESLGQPAQPKLVSLEREGVPSLAKVRCVHELQPAPPTELDEVATMEKALRQAGCGASWWENVRLRGSLVVTWRALDQPTGNLSQTCRALDWCGLRWSAPSRRQAVRLRGDAWFTGNNQPRCVARLP